MRQHPDEVILVGGNFLDGDRRRQWVGRRAGRSRACAARKVDMPAAGRGKRVGQPVEVWSGHQLQPGLDSGDSVMIGNERYLLRVLGVQAMNGVKEVDVGNARGARCPGLAERADGRLGQLAQPSQHELARHPLQRLRSAVRRHLVGHGSRDSRPLWPLGRKPVELHVAERDARDLST